MLGKVGSTYRIENWKSKIGMNHDEGGELVKWERV